jgi:L-ribulose-5-phosphate 3-epimerase
MSDVTPIPSEPLSRRSVLRGALAVAAAAGPLSAGLARAADAPAPSAPSPTAPAPVKLRKAVKFDMINVKGASVADKFALIKRLGFEGVEMNSPAAVDRAEVVAACKATGVVVHGVVDSTHWAVRHSDPKPEVRAKAMADLLGAIKDCQTYGGTTVLLVPGKVSADKAADESFDKVWERSTAAVREVIPAAKAAGVKIAIEVVWNNFLTTSDMLVKYVDQFADPAGKSAVVGAYFDCSNMIKYGEPSATWVRKLGKRLLKFDFKGYNGRTNKWVPIGEGTEDWPEVLKALAEVGYEGQWATAEVSGGGEDRLREIGAAMDKVLGLGK